MEQFNIILGGTIAKKLIVNCFRADCGSCLKDIVNEVEKHCRTFYRCANRCASLYDDIFAKREEINEIELEQNSILVEKWKGKAYRCILPLLYQY